MIKVGIVDDHAIVRSGLKQFFSEQVDLRVVGEAASGREAIDLVRTTEMDVLVMDLSMPGQSGIDALGMIRAKAPDVGILILSGYPEEHYAMNLIRQGSTDFVRDISEKNYWDGCRRLSQEVDGELYIHIEKMNGRSFLTIMRGKHRGMPVLDEADKYLVLELHKIGGLRPDIDGPDSSLKKVGGGPIGSGEEFPFWDGVPSDMMAQAA